MNMANTYIAKFMFFNVLNFHSFYTPMYPNKALTIKLYHYNDYKKTFER